MTKRIRIRNITRDATIQLERGLGDLVGTHISFSRGMLNAKVPKL